MITADGGATNGAVDTAEAAPRLKRELVFDRVNELVADGADRRAALLQVVEEGLTVTFASASSAYYAERKRRVREVTEGEDPQAAIVAALAELEEAVAHAKLVIASAVMQFERLREDAAKYAELRKLIK